ncbi:MAG: hypothetical protein L0099_17015 [Acidobacteria bacterium]|nr:hypothetical protein [Acidobacteriota bacterium]
MYQAVVNPDSEGKPDSSHPILLISARRISGTLRSPVPLKLIKQGGGSELGESYTSFAAEIPIDEKERRKKAEEYVERLANEVKSDKTAREGLKRVYGSAGGRKSLAETMERLYMQNQVGTFEVNCQLLLADPLVTLQSRPARFEIEYKGDFFDQPQFR